MTTEEGENLLAEYENKKEILGRCWVSLHSPYYLVTLVSSMNDYLVTDHGLNLDTLEVISHSLSAQISDYVVKNAGAGKIYAIVGLDPALPLFSYNKLNKRLNSDDAHYVETIQKCGGKLGFLKPIGKSSFYPNDAKNQPGCGTDLTGASSHDIF